MLIQSRKAKGRWLENLVAEMIRNSGLDPNCRRQQLSGSGYKKSDLDTSLNYAFEAKFHKTGFSKLWKAWEQSQKATLGVREPAVVVKKDYSQESEVLIVIRFQHFLDLLKNQKTDKIEIKNSEIENRELKFALENLKTAIKKVLKFYEKDLK